METTLKFLLENAVRKCTFGKEKLRRFSFHGAASYRKAIFKQEIADLMKDEEAQVDSRMM